MAVDHPEHGDDGAAIKTAYQELVRQANQSAARPKGWRADLKSAYWDSGPLEVVLVRHWEDLVDLVPVPVPEHVARHHPAVKAYLANRDSQMVTKGHVPRAARILQAMVDEALRRGFDVLTADQAKPVPGSRRAGETVGGQLVLRAPAGCAGSASASSPVRAGSRRPATTATAGGPPAARSGSTAATRSSWAPATSSSPPRDPPWATADARSGTRPR